MVHLWYVHTLDSESARLPPPPPRPRPGVTAYIASRHGQMGVGGGGGPKNHLWVRTTAARSKEGAVYL